MQRHKTIWSQGFMTIFAGISVLEKFKEGFVRTDDTVTPVPQHLALDMLLAMVHSQSGRTDKKFGSEPEKLWKYEKITKLKDSWLRKEVTEICAANKGHNLLQEMLRVQKNSIPFKKRIA